MLADPVQMVNSNPYHLWQLAYFET